jgi:predicted dehydrogenase
MQPHPSNPPLRAITVGFGYWGPNLARNFAGSDSFELTAICDPDEKKRAQAARQYPHIATYGSLSEALASEDCDVVALATPMSTHHPLGKEALAAGKHVLIEKPLATSLELAMALMSEAESRGLTLMTGHTFVYSSAVRKIEELMQSGEIGNVYYYDSVRINLGLFQHDANVLWDLAVHDLSILDYLVPLDIEAISAIGQKHGPSKTENIAYLTLFGRNGLLAHIHVNWLAPVKIRRTIFAGDQKMVVYDDLQPDEKVRVYDTGITAKSSSDIAEIIIGYRTGDIWTPRLTLSEPLSSEIEHFADCIRSGAQPDSGGRAGARVVAMLEAASRSLEQQGKPVPLSLPEALR